MSLQPNHYGPEEAANMLLNTGIAKAYQRIDLMISRNFIGGALTSVGGMITLLVKGGCNGLLEKNPAIVNLLAGLVFPVGAVMSTLTGGELSTGNVLFLSVALFQRKIPLWRALYCFMVSFFANLAGSLFYLLIAHYGHILSYEPYRQGTILSAEEKVIDPSGATVFVRAIGANWLICIGTFTALLSRTAVAKVIAIWIPIFVFVAVGFENSVANMFLVPIAMINGAPVSVGLFIWKSLILSTLGNIVGGFFFVAGAYWYIYIFPQVAAEDDDNLSMGKAPGPLLPIAEGHSLQLDPVLTRMFTRQTTTRHSTALPNNSVESFNRRKYMQDKQSNSQGSASDDPSTDNDRTAVGSGTDDDKTE
ncbi:Formate/nitrite transporter-domain-containing protein [Myxozyma melibiosi]|uniref:Formate/nitrite transporter-domain-containing protein n=1 Tax=Myxozyma melibiosi TaxID=54550 RepID=A0ABR1F7V0_9ASCO